MLPVAGAVLLAAIWPLTALKLSPAVLPVLLVAAVVGVLVLRRPDAGLALTLALSPLTNLVVGGTKPLQFLLPALVGGLLVYGLVTHGEERGRRMGALPAAVLLYLLTAVISSLYAIDPAQATNTLFGRAAAVGLFFAVVQIGYTRQRLHVIVAGAAAGLLVAAAHGQLQQILGQTGSLGVVVDGAVVGRIQGSFGHPNQYGGYLVALMPLAAGLALSRGMSRRMRIFAASAFVLALAPLAASYTRGAVLGLVAGTLLWLAVVRPRQALMTLLAAAVLGTALAPAAFKERLRDNNSGDIGLRTDLWRSALDIYSESPVLGVGLDNFSTAYARLPATVSEGSQRRLLHQTQVLIPPHANNLYLTILAEQGIAGTAAFLFLLLAALTMAHRLSRSRGELERVVGIGIGAALGVIAVHSVLDYTLTSELSLPLFALLGVGTRLAAGVDDSAAVEGPQVP